MAEIHVGANRPRLLEQGVPPPPASPLTQDPQLLAEPVGPYWTADKAARVMAEGGKALSKLYGPDFKLSAVEVDLVGQPLANVLNDWVALPAGPQGDRIANLLALLAVVGLLVAFRLPDILEAHDLLPRWAYARRTREQRRPRQETEDRAAAPPPAGEPQLEVVQPIAPVVERGEKDWNKYAPTTVGSGYRGEG